MGSCLIVGKAKLGVHKSARDIQNVWLLRNDIGLCVVADSEDVLQKDLKHKSASLPTVTISVTLVIYVTMMWVHVGVPSQPEIRSFRAPKSGETMMGVIQNRFGIAFDNGGIICFRIE